LVVRYRKGSARERRQLRWVLLAAAVTVGAAIWPFLLGELGVLPAVTHGIWATILWLPILLLPVSIVVAVLEPAWLDVDLAIRKTFVYGTLSFLILALYVGVATVSGVAAGAALPLEVAILVAVGVAALFQPARRWLQSVADRWVFGEPPAGYEAVTDFTTAVREATDPGDLVPRIADTTRRALGLRWVGATVEGERPVVVGERTGRPELVAPIEHQGDRFGRIECGPKSKGALTDADVELVTTLASQAALALFNARLAGRIVYTQEAERRRIERNIHDGAQQELVALVARLGMARADLKRDRLSEETLVELQREASRILSDLRELAQGIHPSVLTDGGLLDAIEDRCGRLPIDVSLEATPGLRARRFPDEVEGAAYFFVTEGVANVLKHARASRARIAVRHEDGVLALDVSDDGVGFDPWRVRRTGLSGLSDRIAALGGTFAVTSRPGEGASLRAVLPIESSGASV
ncbi:MAG TPA: histidine kinase, partial [Actinomycetota bacterium]